MDRHGGFAAAIAVSDATLNDLAKVLYFDAKTERHLTANIPALGSIPAVALDDLFIEAPRFILTQAHRTAVGLQLRGRGRVSVTAAGSPQEQRNCFVNLLILLECRAMLLHGRMLLQFDTAHAVLDALEIRPFDGSAFSPALQAHLDSSAFKGLLQLGIQVELAKRGRLIPPFDVGFLGSLASDPGTKATIAFADGALLLGVDINAAGIATAGDKDQLTNFLEGQSLAFWLNPIALPVLLSDLRAGFSTSLSAQGAILESLSIHSEDGGIRIEASASATGGGATFSALLVPRIGEEGEPKRSELRILIEEEEFSIHPAWWAIGLSLAFPLPVGEFVVRMVEMVRTKILASLKQQDGALVPGTSFAFTLPEVTEPQMRIRLASMECREEGIRLGLLMEFDWLKAKLTVPTVIVAEELASPQFFLAMNLHPKFLATSDDPHLRIRWTVRVPGSSGEPLLVVDREAYVGMFMIVGNNDLPFLSHQFFQIQCRLYRALGSRSEELLEESRFVEVYDRLSRAHPYVRWIHQALVPVVRVEPSGAKTVVSQRIKTRSSKIHRTSIPGRCRMASKYSQEWMDFSGVERARLEYLDSLPFGDAAIVANRAKLCDYCFFGGPTKSTPLVP